MSDEVQLEQGGSFLHPSVILAMFAILLFSPLLTLFFLAGWSQQKREPRRRRPQRHQRRGLALLW